MFTSIIDRIVCGAITRAKRALNLPPDIDTGPLDDVCLLNSAHRLGDEISRRVKEAGGAPTDPTKKAEFYRKLYRDMRGAKNGAPAP